MFEEFFPKRLSQLRIQKKVSAREMSLDIGQSSGYINGIENGRGFPSMEMFFCICQYLNIHPKDFFDEELENPTSVSRLQKQLAMLTEEQRQAIMVLTEGLIEKKTK